MMQVTHPNAAELFSSGETIIEARNENRCMRGATRKRLSDSLLIAASGLRDNAESVKPSKKARLARMQQALCLQEKMQQIDMISTLTSLKGIDIDLTTTFPEK
eukprot:4186336-Ditylum_brightwellii.AAC.1